MRFTLLLLAELLLVFSSAGYAAVDTQAFLRTYCQTCHSGNRPAAGLSVAEPTPEQWTKISLRVRNSEMPPQGAPAPVLAEREAFIAAVDQTVHAQVCANGPVPGVAMIRRMNRDEYTATMRELLDIHLNVGHDLPADGAGGQGFDNAAEVLFLSPVLAEKYMDAAKQSLEFAVKDSRARARI
jgi:hypothetical protein